jgi:hypothetical protein
VLSDPGVVFDRSCLPQCAATLDVPVDSLVYRVGQPQVLTCGGREREALMALSIAPEEVVHMTYDENKHGYWGGSCHLRTGAWRNLLTELLEIEKIILRFQAHNTGLYFIVPKLPNPNDAKPGLLRAAL